jgi:hypothetical protein
MKLESDYTAEEMIELLDNWHGLLYEHNIFDLKNLLASAEYFASKVRKHLRDEEKYQ